MRNKDLHNGIDKYIGTRPVASEADKQRVLEYIQENTNGKKPIPLIPRFLSAAVITSLFLFVIGFSLIQSGLILQDEEKGTNPTTSHDPNNHLQQKMGPKQDTYHFVKMKMMNKNTGWALSQQNHLFRTEYGWKTAQDVTPKRFPEKPSSVKMFVLNQKAASIFVKETKNSPIKMFMTDNGGNSWRLENLNSIEAYGIEDVFFQNEKEGWLYTSKFSETSGILPSKLYHTEDGGRSWKSVETNNLDQSQSKWVYFINDKKGWSIGQKGIKNSDGFDQTTTALYETNDGGHHWTRLSLLENQGLSMFIRKPISTGKSLIFPAIQYNNKNGEATLFIFQYDYNKDKWILKGKMAVNTSDLLEIKIDFLNPSKGWLIVGQDLYETTNGGQSWERTTGLKQFNLIYDLQFISGEFGYLISDSGLYITTNGGEKWVKQNKSF